MNSKPKKKAKLGSELSKKDRRWVQTQLRGDLCDWKRAGNDRAIRRLLRLNPKAQLEMLLALSKGKPGKALAMQYDQKVSWSGTALLRNMVGQGLIRPEPNLRYSLTKQGRKFIEDHQPEPATLPSKGGSA